MYRKIYFAFKKRIDKIKYEIHLTGSLNVFENNSS